MASKTKAKEQKSSNTKLSVNERPQRPPRVTSTTDKNRAETVRANRKNGENQ